MGMFEWSEWGLVSQVSEKVEDECFKGSEEEREGDFWWRGHSGERVYSEKPKRKQGDEKVRKGRVRSS